MSTTSLPAELLDQVVGQAILSYTDPNERKEAILSLQLVSKDWRAAVKPYDEIFLQRLENIVPLRRLVNRRNSYIMSRKVLYFGIKGYDGAASQAVKASMYGIFTGLRSTLRHVTFDRSGGLMYMHNARMETLTSLEVTSHWQVVVFPILNNFMTLRQVTHFLPASEQAPSAPSFAGLPDFSDPERATIDNHALQSQVKRLNIPIFSGLHVLHALRLMPYLCELHLQLEPFALAEQHTRVYARIDKDKTSGHYTNLKVFKLGLAYQTAVVEELIESDDMRATREAFEVKYGILSSW